MSHRVTTQTEMKNRDFVMSALQRTGTSHKSLGKNTLEIRSGRSTGKLNLETGEIVGDSDRWKDTDFDALKQAYAVDSYIAELRRQGASIQGETVDTEGNIVILYQTTG